MKKVNIKKLLFLLLICLFAALLILKPEICKQGVATAVILCGRVLIPSLFPFSVCVLFIMKSGALSKLKFLSPVTERLFGLPSDLFVIMLLSMLGGYPIGAKLINEAIENGRLTPEKGGKMLNYCTNAGPAFIVAAVGSGILNSKSLGYILLFSHLAASFIICIFYRFFSGKAFYSSNSKAQKISVADNFVLSASDGAGVTINICGFVILFSAINSYIEYYSYKFPFLKPVLYLTEVTTAVTKTKNIYLISFLLGFAGLCIWCQVLAVGKKIKINLFSFAVSRALHGALSSWLTALILKLFDITLPTFSNNQSFNALTSVSGTALSVALFIMGIVFIISLNGRRNTTKILEEFM